MRTNRIQRAAALGALMFLLQAAAATAQRITTIPSNPNDTVNSDTQAVPPVRAIDSAALTHERDLSGPRIGVTFAGTDGSMRSSLREHGMGPVVSQFGWHFEHTVTPVGAGPTLVTEFIPLFGGVEYGKVIPSLTVAAGLRLASGLEFGAGPSFTLSNSEGETSTGLVLAVGKTMDYGGVNLPVNLAVSTNNKGSRITLVAGYAIQRAAR